MDFNNKLRPIIPRGALTTAKMRKYTPAFAPKEYNNDFQKSEGAAYEFDPNRITIHGNKRYGDFYAILIDGKPVRILASGGSGKAELGQAIQNHRWYQNNPHPNYQKELDHTQKEYDELGGWEEW